MAAISEGSSSGVFFKFNSRIDNRIKIQLICSVGTRGFQYVIMYSVYCTVQQCYRNTKQVLFVHL